MSKDSTNSRGRPRTPLVQRLRVIAWSHQVMASSGLSQADEFEQQLAKRQRRLKLSPGLWSRYMRGEVLPQGALTAKSRTLVDRIDAVFPDTARVFNHPLWNLLDFDRWFSPDELRTAFLKLDEEIWTQYVACGTGLRGPRPPAMSRFWRIQLTEGERKYRLNRNVSLDGLAACVIEARMSYLGQNQKSFVNSLLMACSIMRKLREESLYSTKRMQSVLMLMEAACLFFLHEMTIQAPPVDEAHSELRRQAKRWIDMWIDRCEEHRASLSKSSRTVFERWLKETIGLRGI